MTKPTVTIQSLKVNAPLATTADLNLAVTVSCPPQDPSTVKARGRLNLAIAIDQSSSMGQHGGKALREAKSCASRVVSALLVGDRVSIISFDHTARIVVAATEVTTDKSAILTAISQVKSLGNTDVHGGWIAAATQAASGLAPDVLTRVMLLSDGNTNTGLRNVDEICRQVAALAATGIATTTIGLGTNFDEDLMSKIAFSGQGMATYGETAEDLWPTFEAEFGLLSATCGKNVRLRMSSPCGGTISVENGFPTQTPGVWILPNMVHGAEMTALVKVAVSGLQGADAHVLEISLAYEDVTGVSAPVISAAKSLPLVDFAAFVIGVSNTAVAESLKENEAARLQTKAQQAAKHHDFAAVREIAKELVTLSEGSAWIAGMGETMLGLAEAGDARMLSKETTYAATSLRSNYKTSGDVNAANTSEFLKKRTSQGKAN